MELKKQKTTRDQRDSWCITLGSLGVPSCSSGIGGSSTGCARRSHFPNQNRSETFRFQ